MSFSEISSSKTLARDTIKSKFSLPRRSKILVGVHFTQIEMTRNLLEWLAVLPANFVVFWLEKSEVQEYKNICYSPKIEDIDTKWLDAIICDCTDVKLENFMQEWVVPIVNEKNYLWKILSEFHPGRAEGNSYLYQDSSSWSAYYWLIRYLENHKFPYDNRNLVKNVIWL